MTWTQDYVFQHRSVLVAPNKTVATSDSKFESSSQNFL